MAPIDKAHSVFLKQFLQGQACTRGKKLIAVPLRGSHTLNADHRHRSWMWTITAREYPRRFTLAAIQRHASKRWLISKRSGCAADLTKLDRHGFGVLASQALESPHVVVWFVARLDARKKHR